MITYIGHDTFQSDGVIDSLTLQFYTQFPELRYEATNAQRVGTHSAVDRKSDDLIRESRHPCLGEHSCEKCHQRRGKTRGTGHKVHGALLTWTV